MLRSTVLLVLAAVLATSSLWLTWGEKSVVYEECGLDVERGRVCRVQEAQAAYDPGFLRGRSVWFEVVGDEVQDSEAARFWHRYDAPAQGDVSWWRSPVLPWARPLLLASAVAAPAAVAVGWVGRRRWTARAAWAPLAAAGLSGAAFLASLGGMALHASGWTASRVEGLEPAPGTWVLAAAGVAGVAGGLRMHVALRDLAEGRTGASPLVPADALYGFSDGPEPTEAGAVRPRRVSLHWPQGGGFAVAVVVLLLLPLGLPLATKDITLRDCADDPERGSVCTHEPLSVTYHAAHATVFRVGGDASAEELLSIGGPHYYGPFQEAHGGPSWMGVGAAMAVLGAAGLLGWLAASAADRGTGRLRVGASLLLAGGFLLAVLGVAVQAGSWVGAPAHASRPAEGLFAGVLGLVVLGVWNVGAWRADRASRAASGTATTTSRAG